jgi:hypothetical protein
MTKIISVPESVPTVSGKAKPHNTSPADAKQTSLPSPICCSADTEKTTWSPNRTGVKPRRCSDPGCMMADLDHPFQQTQILYINNSMRGGG